MKASLLTSQSYGQELKSQAALVAAASADASETIGKAVSQITARLEDVEKTAGSVSVKSTNRVRSLAESPTAC